MSNIKCTMCCVNYGSCSYANIGYPCSVPKYKPPQPAAGPWVEGEPPRDGKTYLFSKTGSLTLIFWCTGGKGWAVVGRLKRMWMTTSCVKGGQYAKINLPEVKEDE